MGILFRFFSRRGVLSRNGSKSVNTEFVLKGALTVLLNADQRVADARSLVQMIMCLYLSE